MSPGQGRQADGRGTHTGHSSTGIGGLSLNAFSYRSIAHSTDCLSGASTGTLHCRVGVSVGVAAGVDEVVEVLSVGRDGGDGLVRKASELRHKLPSVSLNSSAAPTTTAAPTRPPATPNTDREDATDAGPAPAASPGPALPFFR